jgi:hypothetical protein
MSLYCRQAYKIVLKPLLTATIQREFTVARNNTNLYLPTVNITKYYKGPYISGLKAFNHLPLHMKSLANDMTSFKTSLKRFLYHHSFYSVENAMNIMMTRACKYLLNLHAVIIFALHTQPIVIFILIRHYTNWLSYCLMTFYKVS